MSLFPNLESDYLFKGKSHTNLVVSEGNAPAQEWVVAKEEGTKFQYVYGPEGNQNVVIAKGKIVEAAGVEYDDERSRKMNAIKQATAGSSKVIGVNHHNLYERKRDRFSGGNQGNPVLITRSVIEVPLFEHDVLATAQGFADAMKFGAAYAANANVLMPGDYVKAGADGNFVKLDTATDSPFLSVGQVIGVEKELPPAGFLQYYLDMNIPQLEEFFKNKSHAPSPGNNGKDAGAYPYGYPYANKGWKGDFEKLLNPTINKGIPFLTDGYFKAKQTVTGIALNDLFNATSNADGHVENVVFSGGVTFGNDTAVPGTFVASVDNAIDSSVKTAADTRNNALFIKLKHEIDKAEVDRITVKHDGGAFKDSDVHVDFTNNMVVVYLDADQEYLNIAVDAKLIVNPVAGVPTEWDYAGSVGAIKILLQK